MKSKVSGIGQLAAGAFAAVLSFVFTAQAWAEDAVGRPTDGAIDFQPAASQIKHDVIVFHNWLLLPIITAISLFVLALLLIVIFRFNKRANPTPARWSHNTPIEIIWTVVPVIILMVIAVFSFKLLYEIHDMPKPYMTVKVTGRQWNWDYEYPDQKIAAYTSTVMSEADAKAKGVPYRLASTAPMYAPVNQVVRVQVTGEDVIHSFAMPAFGVKIDAIPGKLNQTWFKADRTGVFYGQCSELCGIDHAFMPIEIHVVTQPEFDAWVASKAPKPVAAAAAAPAAPAAATPAAATPAPPPAAAAAPAPAAAPAATH